MTRTEYVMHLKAMYRIANMSDAHDDADRPDWLKGVECATHCQPLDRIVEEMGLGPNWLEETDFELPGPMTLEEFRATRQRVTDIGDHTGDSAMDGAPGFVYLDGGWWIEMREDGMFWCLFGGSDRAGTLAETEEWLFGMLSMDGNLIRR